MKRPENISLPTIVDSKLMQGAATFKPITFEKAGRVVGLVNPTAEEMKAHLGFKNPKEEVYTHEDGSIKRIDIWGTIEELGTKHKITVWTSTKEHESKSGNKLFIDEVFHYIFATDEETAREKDKRSDLGAVIRPALEGEYTLMDFAVKLGALSTEASEGYALAWDSPHATQELVNEIAHFIGDYASQEPKRETIKVILTVYKTYQNVWVSPAGESFWYSELEMTKRFKESVKKFAKIENPDTLVEYKEPSGDFTFDPTAGASLVDML